MYLLWYLLLLQGHCAQVQQPHFQSLKEGRDALVIVWKNCPKFTGSQLKGHFMTDYEHLHENKRKD